MTFKDDLLADESIVFNENDISIPIRFTTVKGTVFDNQLANINENSTGLIMNEGIETNKSDASISISRRLFDEIGINESNINGCRILNKKNNNDWTVMAIASKNQLVAVLVCQRMTFSRAKA